VRVAIDTSIVSRGRSGTAVYVEELVRALRERGEVEVVETRQRARLRPGRSGRRRNPFRSAANALLDLAWQRAGLPRAVRRARAEVLHHPLPARSPRARCAEVVTVHDVAFERHPEWFDPAWRAVARREHRAAARHADAVICISERTARDAISLLSVPPERVVVAPHGRGQLLPRPSGPRGSEHFLYVGSDEPRKDVAGLLAAYGDYRREQERPLPLVLAGQAGRRAGGSEVRGEPEPPPERLAELLHEAAALVHPAPLEGFGLTLLEAMAAGTPVVAVRSDVAEEVCGNAALLTERGRLPEALASLHHDADLRERLSRMGRERAAAFSWERSAALHERAYRDALERRRAAPS
jgi:glycosyltransferase involved in cell wall biosynthesis